METPPPPSGSRARRDELPKGRHGRRGRRKYNCLHVSRLVELVRKEYNRIGIEWKYIT